VAEGPVRGLFGTGASAFGRNGGSGTVMHSGVLETVLPVLVFAAIFYFYPPLTRRSRLLDDLLAKIRAKPITPTASQPA